MEKISVSEHNISKVMEIYRRKPKIGVSRSSSNRQGKCILADVMYTDDIVLLTVDGIELKQLMKT